MRITPDQMALLRERFVNDLPRIERAMRFRFRRLGADRREEALAEAVALAWKSYLVLATEGRDIEPLVGKIAEYCARAVNSGRKLADKHSVTDALSLGTRIKHDFHIDSLPPPDREDVAAEVLDALRDGREASPAEQAALNVDYADFLAGLRPHQRAVVEKLASGLNTVEVGRPRGVTYGAVSNPRRALRKKWEERQR